MTVIQVVSASGGVGASTVAWSLARSRPGSLALDISPKQGGLAFAAGVGYDARVCWPRISEDADSSALRARVFQFESAGLISGGIPPDADFLRQLVTESSTAGEVVIDGLLGGLNCKDFTVGCITNQLPNWQARSRLPAAIWVVRMLKSGLTLAEMQSESDQPILALRDVSAIRMAWALGIGIPASPSLRRVVEQIWQMADAI